MKIRRLNEDAKRFYVDEIVSAPGGKTETERHSFATLDELKKYCKDAGLTKDDIANCGGCDVKDLCESYFDVKIPRAVKEFVDNLCDKISADQGESDEEENEDPWSTEYGYNENLWDRGTGGDYNVYGKPSSYYADEVMEAVIEEFGDVIKTDEQKLAVYCYVEFMDEPEWVDTLSEDTDITKDASFTRRSPKEQKIMLMKQGLSSDGYNGYVFAVSDDCSHHQLVRLRDNKIIHDNPSSLSDEDLLNLCEDIEKLHTKPNGEYLVKADSGKGYTAFSRDNVAIGGIDNEDADSDDKAIDKFKRNEYSECLNEAYFDTAEYRIQKYEDDIPELMAGMHDDYMEGKLDAARYSEVLKKVYDALAECDYKHTMSEPVGTNGAGKRVLARLAELDETNEALGIGAGLALGGAAIGAGMVGSALLDSVEDENKEEEEILTEGSDKCYAAKYSAIDSEGNKTQKKICFMCDGTIEDAEKLADELINEPYTELKVVGSCLRGNAEDDGFTFVEGLIGDINVNLDASGSSVGFLGGTAGLTNEDVEDEYDDDYDTGYDDSLEECSGIKAHKVVMGEGVDDIGIDGDLGDEGPTGDKTEDIEFVMDEYIGPDFLIDAVNKLSPTKYEVTYNGTTVLLEFDPKWSEYVYTINGKGPHSHSSYEWIISDIRDYVNTFCADDDEFDDDF